MNGLSLEFIAFYCQISLEDPTGTRLQECQVQMELLKVLLLDLLMSFPRVPHSHELRPNSLAHIGVFILGIL